MNLSLLDPFQSDFPEVIEECLEHRVTRCIAFNRRGTLLAAGCTHGACVIWDLDTRGVAKELLDPECSAAITSVSWSKCGYRLLAAAANKMLYLWDVAAGVRIGSFALEQTALHARLHPGMQRPWVCMACPISSAPVLVDLESGTMHVLPVVVVVDVALVPAVAVAPAVEPAAKTSGKIADSGLYSPCAASFNKKGDLVYVGNARGEVLILDSSSRKVVCHVPVPGGASIRQVVFSRNGHYMLTNSSDRVIRVFENLVPAGCNLQEWLRLQSTAATESGGSQCLRLSKEFQETVNRIHWKSACFNSDSECVVGASANKAEHKIHIWNRKFGQLARILECPKEGLADLAWHPTRPLVASVTTTGVVYLWAKDYTENWSAFAPDFKELEENEEYVEREDEFDIRPPEADKVKPAPVEDDVEVDILTADRVGAFSDTDHSDDGLYFLPTGPLPDPPADHAPHQSSSRERSGTPDSKGSPVFDAEDDCNPHSSHCFAQEADTGQDGRLRRKRKLSKKAAALQADMGKKPVAPRLKQGPGPGPGLAPKIPVLRISAAGEDAQGEELVAKRAADGHTGQDVAQTPFKRIGYPTSSNGMMRYLNIVGKRIPRLRPVAALNPRTPVLPHVA